MKTYTVFYNGKDREYKKKRIQALTAFDAATQAFQPRKGYIWSTMPDCPSQGENIHVQSGDPWKGDRQDVLFYESKQPFVADL